jgi:peptidoglycan/LPS O-acetylase OafA/YrhL
MENNPEAEKLDEYAAVDVLRFILASAVMLAHMGVLSWLQSGNLAVQVFFALSGWLIGGILYKTDSQELCRFYYNRSTRVWIPYFFTVAALYLISLTHEPLSPRWFRFLAFDLTFTHNWFALWPNADIAVQQMPLHGTGNHFWSLAVEEQFYLIAPLAITLFPAGRKLVIWVGIAAVAYFSRSEYASICLGVLAAVAARKYVNWYRSVPGRILLLVTIIVTAIGMIYSLSYSFFAPVFSICVVLLCATPLRRNAATRWLGGISFPFYLNAWIGTFALHSIEKHFAIPLSWYSRPLEFLAGITAAALSYELLDARVMANRNRFYNRSVGWALGTVGYLLVLSGVVYWIVVSKAA